METRSHDYIFWTTIAQDLDFYCSYDCIRASQISLRTPTNGDAISSIFGMFKQQLQIWRSNGYKSEQSKHLSNRWVSEGTGSGQSSDTPDIPKWRPWDTIAITQRVRLAFLPLRFDASCLEVDVEHPRFGSSFADFGLLSNLYGWSDSQILTNSDHMVGKPCMFSFIFGVSFELALYRWDTLLRRNIFQSDDPQDRA